VKKKKDREEKDIQDITYSAVLMENEDVIAILDYDFFQSQSRRK
jgi:predicted nucleic acid-binding protein